jgi:hypothetical protein
VPQVLLSNNSRVADALRAARRSNARDALAAGAPDRSGTTSARSSCACGAAESAAWHATAVHTAKTAVKNADPRGLIMPVSMQEIVIKAVFKRTKVILQRFTFPGETWRYERFSVLYR